MANEEFETNQQNANAGDNTGIEKSNSYSADSKQDKQSTNQPVGNMPSPSANATGPDFKGAADKMKSASSTFSGNTQKNSDKNRQPNGDPTGQTFDGQDQSDGSKQKDSPNSNNEQQKNSQKAAENANSGSADSGGSGGAGGAADAVGIANAARGAAQDTAHLYQDNGKSDIENTAGDIKDVAIGAGKVAAKALADDYAGAVKDGVRIIPAILRIVLPILFLLCAMIVLFLSTPAMIWNNINKSYSDWTLKQATVAIDDAVSDAAWSTVNHMKKDLGNSKVIPNFDTLCNSYYDEEHFGGSGYAYQIDGGGEFSIGVDMDGYTGANLNDAVFRYVDPDNNCVEVVYKNAYSGSGSSTYDYTYSEIINAFVKYREKLIEENGVVSVFTEGLDAVKRYIKTGGKSVFIDVGRVVSKIGNSTASRFNMTQVADNFAKMESDLESVDANMASWGLTDTSALYYYMHQSDVADKMYDYSYQVGSNKTDVGRNLISNLDKAYLSDTTEGDTNYHSIKRIIVNVSVFANDDNKNEQLKNADGTTSSRFVQKIFDLTDKEMEEVAGKTLISDAIIEAATNTPEYEKGDEKYDPYCKMTPAHTVYVQLCGGESLLSQLEGDGLLTGNLTEATARRYVAVMAKSYVGNPTLSNRKGVFVTDDMFENMMNGSVKSIYATKDSAGNVIKYNEETFTKGDLAKGEDGLFVTCIYQKALSNSKVKLREYLFPGQYSTKNGKTNQNFKMIAGEEYYEYYRHNLSKDKAVQAKVKNSYHALIKESKPHKEGWKNAFDKNSSTHIKQGDMLFMNAAFYWTAGEQGNELGEKLKNYPNIAMASLFGQKNNKNYDAAFAKYSNHNWAYQVGIVTSVNLTNKTINVAIYNYDDEPFKANLTDYKDYKDWSVTRNIRGSNFTVTNVRIDAKTGTVTPIDKTLSHYYHLYSVTGYAQPDYQSFVDAYNAAYQEQLESMSSSIDTYSTSGVLGWPTKSHKITTGFYGYANHNGVDFAVPVGTKVFAAADGVVAESTYTTSGGSAGNGLKAPNGLAYRSFGEHIYIRSGNVTTQYCHLSKRVAKKGQKVTRGQLIGYSGNTGNSTGPHLHFGYLVNGSYKDPSKLFTTTVKHTYKGRTYSPGTSYKITATHYCACAICNGTGGTGTTASGKKIRNGMSDPHYIACNWLPLGTKISVKIGNKTTVYTVADRGGSDFDIAPTGNNRGRIDIFTPGGHSECYRIGREDGTLQILSWGKG